MTNICIITSTGGIYGSGHASRMAFLAEYLAAKGHPVSIICPPEAASVIPALRSFIAASIPVQTGLIIRDMRDSTPEEILNLKKTAPIAVVDDCGKGRYESDAIIDCLPNLLMTTPLPPPEETPFLFGYSFNEFFRINNGGVFSKDIDLCIYAGQNPEEEYLAKILSAVPSGKRVCITGRGKPHLKEDTYGISAPQNFTEALLRSHALISHFGVTLFEARLCGCALYTVNPTQYHNDLCERTKESIKLTNFGVIDTFSTIRTKQTLESVSSGGQTAASSSVQSVIGQYADRFYQIIKPLL